MSKEFDSEFPDTSYSLIEDLANGSVDRFDEFVIAYEVPMRVYLRKRGINWLDSEDAVADFIARIVENRRIFQLSNPNVRFHRRLRASLLHHLVDTVRKRNTERRHLENIGKMSEQEEEIYSDDPLEFGWAYSILDLAVETYRSVKLQGANLQEDGTAVAPEDMTESQLDWEVFLRRYIGCPDEDLQPKTFTLQQIADRLKLPARGMKDRCARIRRDFQATMKEVLQETISAGNANEYLRDVRFSLMLGNSQCIDLSRLLPEFAKEPPTESVLEFSMISLSQMEPSSLEELIISPEKELDESDLRILWQRLMNSKLYSGEAISGTDSEIHLERNMHDCLFGDPIQEADLQRLKSIAKRRGNDSCSVLRKLHHALYVLTIVVAKFRLNRVITSFSRDEVIESVQRALRYEDWLSPRAKQELELGLRTIVEGEW